MKLMRSNWLNLLPLRNVRRAAVRAFSASLDCRAMPLIFCTPWEMPMAKIRNGTSKWLLRQVLYRHVPASLIDRPKMGFGVPLGDWLRGPLRDWVETLLSEQRLREGGLVDAQVVRRYWQEHLSGRHNWQYLLWDVLMLEAWRETWT